MFTATFSRNSAILTACVLFLRLSKNVNAFPQEDFSFQPEINPNPYTNGQACNNLSPLVAQFSGNFFRTVVRNSTLASGFNIKQLTPKEAGLIFKVITYQLHREGKSQSSAKSADIVQKAIQKNFKNFTWTSLIQMAGNSIGEILEVLGILDEGNFESLSDSLVQEMARSFDLVRVKDPQLKLVNFITGYRRYLAKNKVLISETTILGPTLFAKQAYEV